MQRKIISKSVILVLGFVFCFAPYRAAGDILSDRQQIESLIEANKLKEAQTQIDKLKADYSQDSGLPETLYWIAERYRWEHKWEQVINLHNQIIQDYPDSSFASRANLGIARAEVLSLLIAEDFDGAQQALDELLADFTGHPDMPETLYWIAEEYKWKQKYDKAISIHQQNVQNYPDSPFASKSRLGLSRTEILSLIGNRQYEQADEAIETMLDDFAGHPDLPGTLYWIGREYEWTSKYEEAKKAFELIVRKYPNSSVTDKAMLGVERTEAGLLIKSGQTEEAKTEVEKIKTDFAGRPDLGGTLYEIAGIYDYEQSLEEAIELHSSVATNYSDKEYGNKSSIQEAKLNIFLLIDANNYSSADAATAHMREDFTDSSDLPTILLEIGQKYAAKAYEYENSGDHTRAIECFQKAISVLEEIISESTATANLICNAYYSAAFSYQGIREPEQAILYYQKVLDEWPDYDNCWRALFMIGGCYELLEEAGQISTEDAASEIDIVCEKLLNYSDIGAAMAYKSLRQRWEITNE